MQMALRICYLYPELMNIYGDRGNVIAITKRCRWRGIDVRVDEVGLGEKIPTGKYDLFFMGGGQDREQVLVCKDLMENKGDAIKREIDNGASALVICGAYQLFGKFYRPAQGDELPGIGVFDAYTIAGNQRFIGNVVVTSALGGKIPSVVGFENHSGRTYLGCSARPLGNVTVGYGNNGEDKTEGAVYMGAVGTYLHGSLLPKNPALCDWLILNALRRRESGAALSGLDDTIELNAHRFAVERARKMR